MVQLYDLITELKKNGTLAELLNAGLMSPKVLLYYDLYGKFKFYIERNYKTTEAVRQTALTTNVCERTIYKAISVMRYATAYNGSVVTE
jgi:hypothetical protein